MSKKEHQKKHEETISDSEPEAQSHDIEQSDIDQDTHPSIFKRWWGWVCTNKKISIPAAALVVLVLLVAVPFTRYAVAGMILKQSFSVVVIDAETGKPVSSATVRVAGKGTTTDSEGRANLVAKVGRQNLEVSKNYYEASVQKVLIPIGKPASSLEVKLKATGRPVPVTVFNKISQKATPDITITAEGTEARTGEDGKTVLVVPADRTEITAKLSGEGFNTADVALTVTSDEIEANKFSVTPSGKIYFLSNASGKIDLVKSDLDGANRQTVLAGTGKEDKNNTILLASRDWKYIALLSKRDGGEYAKLFLIETDNDKLTTMDEGEATFNLYGWSGDRFVYKVNREKIKFWESKRQALKTYHAPGKKITTLVETAAEGSESGYVYESFEDTFVLDQEIVFANHWYWNGNAYAVWKGKQSAFSSMKADGSQKKTIKSYNDHYINARTADFGEVYIRYHENENDNNSSKVDAYRDGKIGLSDENPNDFYNESYPFYSVSPSGNKTLWSEYRDGKNVFFVGDNKGENGKEIGRIDGYSTYGWFTDNYVLLTKKDSEMHILPVEGLEGGIDKGLKISDYYKPQYYRPGFGYGYGG